MTPITSSSRFGHSRIFVDIRGCHADNGSQLAAADVVLKSLDKIIDVRKLREYGSPRSIVFRFSKPGSHSQNGCSEALIKSVKRSLRCLAGSDAPRLTVLQLLRVLSGVANVLNERPIGKHPKGHADGKFLCPKDLLLGRASSGPWSDVGGKAGEFTRQLILVERVVDEWWKTLASPLFPYSATSA